MKKHKQLTGKTLNSMYKEVERVKYLQERINKMQNEINDLKEENNWMRYLSGEFTEVATEEQMIEFSRLKKIIT